MIHAAYRRLDDKVPPPRIPQLVTPEQKGYVTAAPWMCKPYQDAQTLGLELRWTTDYTLTIRNIDGRADYELDFGGKPEKNIEGLVQQFSANHYGVNTRQQILLPPGFNGLILPHPRFFDPVPENAYNDTPSVVPGLLEMDFWPAMFFVACTLPQPGTEHIFYAGEPFCQIVAVPRGDIIVRPMTDEEAELWNHRDKFVRTRRLAISTHTWTDERTGGTFGNSYKVLAKEIRTLGWEGVEAKYPKVDE